MAIGVGAVWYRDLNSDGPACISKLSYTGWSQAYCRDILSECHFGSHVMLPSHIGAQNVFSCLSHEDSEQCRFTAMEHSPSLFHTQHLHSHALSSIVSTIPAICTDSPLLGFPSTLPHMILPHSASHTHTWLNRKPRKDAVSRQGMSWLDKGAHILTFLMTAFVLPSHVCLISVRVHYFQCYFHRSFHSSHT